MSLETPDGARELSDQSKSEVDTAANDEHHPTDPEKGNAAIKGTETALDWSGPDDPENPLNWPNWKRYFHVIPPAVIAFSASFGTSVYSPAVSQVMSQFSLSRTAAIVPLTLYVLALGLGPTIAAPLSETYGRRAVYLLSAPLGSLFAMGAGLAPSFAGLCALRFLAGMCFSPSLAVGSGTIGDVTVARERATLTVAFILAPFVGPALGPVVGAFAATRRSWRWTQYAVDFFGAFSFLLILCMRETYKKTILQRRARRRRRAAAAAAPPPGAAARTRLLLTATLLRPLHMLLTEPIVGFLSLYVAFNFSVLFGFFAAFPYVFESVYGFGADEAGLVFLAVGVGCLLAVPTALLSDRLLYQPRLRPAAAAGAGHVAPEHRLYPAMLGGPLLVVGLFWLAWTARPGVSWVAPVMAAVPFAWGNLSVFISAALYMVDTYQAANGASSMAANGLLRYLFGAVFPLFTVQMYQNLGIGWATSLFGFIAAALMPVPWVLFKYGKAIRANSQYDTIKA